jgi:phosphoglycerate dehydrogenase-like enzyme
VLGLGNIGSEVARIALAFRMRVIAWSQNLTEKRAAAAGAELVSKDELFRQADVLTIHLVLSRRTRGLVGRGELALMKPTALLVNTSRGPIIDEAALIEALRERRIARAALDVFNEEPLPADHPYRSLDNVLATPHIGYVCGASTRLSIEIRSTISALGWMVRLFERCRSSRRATSGKWLVSNSCFDRDPSAQGGELHDQERYLPCCLPRE